MKLDRKSLSQIVLLVVLLVLGAGGYLWQQGLLDPWLGEEPAPVPVAIAPKPKPIPPPKPKEELPTIPATPATGEIRKVPFTVERAEIENGVLTLRQGVAPLGTEVVVRLRTKPWEIPAGQSFKIINAAPGSEPQVQIGWHEEDQLAPRRRQFTEKYTLLLELGTEQDNRIPGKIFLSLPDEDKSQVAGVFDAEIRGFRLVNGKPDLSVDAIDTLQFLALRELLKDDPDRPLADLSFRHGRWSAKAEPVATGYLEVAYRAGDAMPVAQKFQFAKEANEWRVVRVLRPDQLDEAHPYKVPGAKDAPGRLFPYLAAQRIEADARKKSAGRPVTGVEFAPRYNEKYKIGVCDVSYRLGDDQPVQTTFLYRLGPNGWTLARELSKKERVNLAKGKVETTR